MEKKESLKAFDDLIQAKKSNVLSVKLIIGFAFAVVFCTLLWGLTVHLSTLEKVKVVDRLGNVARSSLEDKTKLLRSLIENHCANTIYFLNSFDRITIKENQSRAVFLVNAQDADRVFEQYNTNKNYYDVLARGVTFQANYKKLLESHIDQEPYTVKFESTLIIHDNDKPVQKYQIISEGELIHTTPQYPENPVGLYFKKYTQVFRKLPHHE